MPRERPAVEDLTFRARALAQAHALTPAASSYRRWRVDRNAPTHPIPELSEWAATAFLTGYCLRCVEQSYVGAEQLPATMSDRPDDWMRSWEADAVSVAKAVASRSGATLLDADLIAVALDEIIGREIEKRNEHVRENLTSDDWSDFEAFIAWWVVHGYAIRAVETSPVPVPVRVPV